MLRAGAVRVLEHINADGRAPVIVCCDHAGRCVPAGMDGLGLSEAQLESHIVWDIGARAVAVQVARGLGAPLLLANYSRLVIDLNRQVDDETLIPEVSDGVVIEGNVGLSEEERQRRIDTLFTPYHVRYARMVGRLKEGWGRPIILSVHSFVSTLQGVRRAWDFGLLWDECEELGREMGGYLEAEGDVRVGQNEPYSAWSPHGYAMGVHAQGRGVEMALVEINQARIMDAAGQAWAAELVVGAVLKVLRERGWGG